ncbi:hypothetical protein D3C71_2233360 [compost metagenome]
MHQIRYDAQTIMLKNITQNRELYVKTGLLAKVTIDEVEKLCVSWINNIEIT